MAVHFGVVGVAGSNPVAPIGRTTLSREGLAIFKTDTIGHSRSRSFTFCQVLRTNCVRGSGRGLVIKNSGWSSTICLMSSLKAFIGGILDIKKRLVIKFPFLWRLFIGLSPFPLFFFFSQPKRVQFDVQTYSNVHKPCWAGVSGWTSKNP